jgi:hypothetical protein
MIEDNEKEIQTLHSALQNTQKERKETERTLLTLGQTEDKLYKALSILYAKKEGFEYGKEFFMRGGNESYIVEEIIPCQIPNRYDVKFRHRPWVDDDQLTSFKTVTHADLQDFYPAPME